MREKQEPSQLNAQGESVGSSNVSPCRTSDDLSHDSLQEVHQSDYALGHAFELYDEQRSSSAAAKSNISAQQTGRNKEENSPPPAPAQIKISQPIGRLCGAVKAGSVGPVTLKGEIPPITDEEILKDRESEEGIQRIPRFRNYQPGNPSKVPWRDVMIVIYWDKLELHQQDSCLFFCHCRCCAWRTWVHMPHWPSWWHCSPGLSKRVVHRCCTGCWRVGWRARHSSLCRVRKCFCLNRSRDTAINVFIHFLSADAETAQRALQLLHGYRGLGKPLVVEFGRERQEAEKQGKEVEQERTF